MTLRQLKWIAVLGPVVGLAILEAVTRVLYPVLLSWPARLLLDSLLVVCTLVFYSVVFGVIGQMQHELARRNRELEGLYLAGVDVGAELGIEEVLQKVVDLASELLDARYGALALYEDDSRISAFLTSGIEPELRSRIGDPPRGEGLLGVVLRDGERLRLSDLTRDPRSTGFPPDHPEMRSLLAVPIPCTTSLRGNLYVAEKRGSDRFSADDEKTLVRFAAQVANAMDNAHLHDRVRRLAVAEERARIAREMHDGLAQVLGYVNTKVQAASEHLERGQPDRARSQLDQLAVAARDAYADLREGILGLRISGRTGGAVTESLEELVDHFTDETGIAAKLSLDGRIELSPEVELQTIRIVQEALANVRKHAEADTVHVCCARSDGTMLLAIEDDGIGFDPGDLGRSAFPRFGLSTMRERAEAIDAGFELDSAPGEGTRIRVRIPTDRHPKTSEAPIDARAHR